MSADQIPHRLPSYLEYQGKYKGLLGWILSTDHKRIGLLYFYSMITFFLAGVVLGLLMKLELIAPGQTIMTAQTYNGLFTICDSGSYRRLRQLHASNYDWGKGRSFPAD